MFKPNLLFSIILFTNVNLSASSDLKDPWSSVTILQEGKYFESLNTLMNDEDAYLKSNQRNSFLQAFSTLLSYVQQYNEAQKYFDIAIAEGTETSIPNDLSNFKAVDAIQWISNMAKTAQVIMINEAHHVPETRAMTFALLKRLYDSGFRYFAAETFNDLGIIESQQLGFPTRKLGFYTMEPLFADIAREAIKIGFQLVAYEYTEDCNYNLDPFGCQDKREQGQAQNLIDKIFKNDPRAKVLIHAGYGHIDKIGGTDTFPWKPMANYFKDKSGINPFSIDQLTFRSRGSKTAEDKNYSVLNNYYKIKTPTILKNIVSGKHWTGMPGHYDVQIILPQNERNNLRPYWLEKLIDRRSFDPDWRFCKSYPCLIQMIFENEVNNAFIPIDQVFALTRNDIKKALLKKGKYIVRYIYKQGSFERPLLVK